jgi:hypothetical protein
MPIQFSHEELSLMVFALEGPQAAAPPQAEVSCEDACPVASHFEELFAGDSIPLDRQLVRHLNNHLREALLECGMLELMSGEHGSEGKLTLEDQTKLQGINARLREWKCEVSIDAAEQRRLYEAVYRLPRSAWLSMPRTIWRLKKKLKARRLTAEPAVQ